MKTLVSEELIRELRARFEEESPQDILRWALEESGLDRIAMASAFQAEGTAVMHMAVSIRPDIPVLFLDTGFHFKETLRFKQELTERLGLNVVDLKGDYHSAESQAAEFGERMYEWDPNRCCEINKVVPFNRALRGLDAWITAMRRDSSFTRATTPILDQYEFEPGKTLLKVNPIANWTRGDVWRYLKENDMPHHPLYDLGFPSIGCAPCSRLTFPGEDERAGRWSGFNKTECGIHGRETLNEELLKPAPART